jgi:N-methylhydantoinase A
MQRFVDLKYLGQSFELTVPLPSDWTGAGSVASLTTAFAREHAHTYGHAAEGDPIQLVNLRLTARVVPVASRPPVRFMGAPTPMGIARAAYFGRAHGTLDTPVLARAHLDETPRPGPLLIDEYDATTLVPPGATARLDEHGNIRIVTGGRP